MNCQPRLPKAEANAELSSAIRLLRLLVSHQRLHGVSVKGSWLDDAMIEADGLIKRNTR